MYNNSNKYNNGNNNSINNSYNDKKKLIVVSRYHFFSMLPKEKYIINIPPPKIWFKFRFLKTFFFQFCHKDTAINSTSNADIFKNIF